MDLVSNICSAFKLFVVKFDSHILTLLGESLFLKRVQNLTCRYVDDNNITLGPGLITR